jgi:ligand-binding sensor domain-containing protein/serine phosphatase RsbU (regulator of sigma subunit)
MRFSFKTIKFIFLLNTINAFVFSQTFPFSNFTIENGLSQAQVLSTFQDSDGVMWFGTNGGGITKFDGKFFDVISDKDGLADNVVFCMAKDDRGRILIGTNNGLSVYDPNIISQKPLAHFKNYTTANGLTHNRILFIQVDRSGAAILGTAKGVSIFKDGICKPLKLNNKLDTTSVINIIEDSKNNKWYCTLGGGVFKVTNDQVLNLTVADGLKNNMIFSVIERKNNIYWILTGEGLYEYNGKTIRLNNPEKMGNSVTYQFVLRDSRGQLWIGTSEGLLKEIADDKFILYSTKNGLVDNNIWNIFEDRESNLWFASIQNGVSKLASERFFLYNSKDGLLSDEIKQIFENSKGELCVGTKLGLSVKLKDKVTNYTSGDLKGYPEIWDITEDNKGRLLIGMTNGLCVFNGTGFKRIFCKDKENPMNTVLDVFVDRKGEIWLGTQAGVAQVVGGYIQEFKGGQIPRNFINKICEDKNGNILFGTEEGLFSYDGKNIKQYTEKDGFIRKRISSLAVDNNNTVWVATSKGLYKYSNNTFTLFNEKAYSAGDEILSMLFDKNDNLWIGLSDGVDKISFKNNTVKVRHFNGDDSFLGQAISPNAMALNSAGRLMIGTTNGLLFYQDEFDRDNLIEPTTILKSIDLFYQKTDWKLYGDSVKINNIPVDLELPYDKNYLTFNFIGVSLTSPGKVSYRYKLSGVDSDWRESTKTDVSYSNIPPGKYQFILYSNNGESIWNKEPIIFEFTINPPFWRTWWFYSIIGLIVLSGIYSYIKIRAANFKILKQNEIIEEKNEALLYANEEIAEKNQNITDSINYAKRLQQSFLTSEKVLNEILNDHFVLFKPRDIVSGDFYLAFEMPDRTFIFCADCTGHGIPGAFMSLIGISLLNEIKRSQMILGTSEILERLRNNIIAALNPEKIETGGKDGMDVSLIAIFKERVNSEIKIQFSGANNSMYLVTSSHSNPHMVEYKGDKQPVGYYSNMKPFTQQEVVAQKGDIIYLYTDGYADQFGGMNGKKFMSKQLKDRLMSICNYPMSQQKEKLDEVFKSWQGRLEQVDDVTVIGIKLN